MTTDHPHPTVLYCRHATYRMTCEEFGRLVDRSRGACEICHRRVKKLYIDHDHDIGVWAVRGLVCPSCNVLLALRPEFSEEPAVRDYLDNPFHSSGPALRSSGNGPPAQQSGWARIAEDLSARIRAGEYPPGSKLPALHELAYQYSVSVATVQRSIGATKARGLVVGLPGRGVFVTQRDAPDPLSRSAAL